jgi:tetratricopeptide (TPR) repeat protein
MEKNMIIYGSRMYGRKDKVHSCGYCPQCDKYLKQTSYRGRKWAHLNFIPIFPEGPHMHIIKECKKCSVGLQIPIKELPEMIEGIKEDAEKVLGVLEGGNEYFIEEDESGGEVKQSCADALASDTEILYCIGDNDAVEELLSALNKDKFRKIYCTVKGKLLELQGNMEEGIHLYEEAVKNYPDDENAHWLLAAALYNSGKTRESREAYENLLTVAEDKANVMLLLLDVYNELKEYLTMTETFERCFEMHPEYAKQKKFVKRYKKTCKKAGIKPKENLINIK